MILDELRRTLSRAADLAVERHPLPGRPDLMAAAVERLRRDGASAGAGGSSDRMSAALKALDEAGPAAACRDHLRALCWLVAEGRDERAALLDREPELFLRVMEAVQTATARRRLSANAWRGLLAGYFARRPAHGPASANWQALRRFLAAGLPRLLQATRSPPDWLGCISRHLDLLSDHPARRYAALAMAGDESMTDELRDGLGLQPESWFWSELVMSQVEHLASLGDDAYRAGLDRVLSKLAAFPLLASQGLAVLLTRHHRTLAGRTHPGLRDFAIATWGNPHLESQSRWALVSPEVKRMVREWIVREDLILFFEKLSEDRTVDQRRLDFWLGYAGTIDFAYFVFGRNAFESRDPDFAALRRKRQGFYCRLQDAGAGENAVVMKIGERLFVEFTHTGNAAYGYALSSAPFKLDGRALTVRALKDKSVCIFREAHAPTDSWPELKFAPALRRLGIHPAGPPAGAAQHGQTVDWSQVARASAQRHRLPIADHRMKGGAFWVECQAGHPIARDLISLGFQHHPGRGYWKK